MQFICHSCGVQFEVGRKYIDRSYIKHLPKGKYPYCSKKCSQHELTGCQVDHYSPFRVHLTKIRHRAKKDNKQCTLTIDDLKNQWDKQKGICP